MKNAKWKMKKMKLLKKDKNLIILAPLFPVCKGCDSVRE